jgi:hypothetical protein
LHGYHEDVTKVKLIFTTASRWSSQVKRRVSDKAGEKRQNDPQYKAAMSRSVEQVESYYLFLEGIHAIVGLREFFRYSRIAKENTLYRLCDLGEHNGRCH